MIAAGFGVLALVVAVSILVAASRERARRRRAAPPQMIVIAPSAPPVRPAIEVVDISDVRRCRDDVAGRWS